MTARRRKWLIVAALAVLVLAALLWAASSGGKMEVKLVFLGYTNYATDVKITNRFSITKFPAAAQALVLVTTCGPRRIAISMATQRNYHINGASPHDSPPVWWHALTNAFRNSLAPGESLVLTSPVYGFTQPWDFELLVTEDLLKRRLLSGFFRIKSNAVRSRVLTLLSPPKQKKFHYCPVKFSSTARLTR